MPVIDIEYEDEQDREKPEVIAIAKGKVEKRSLFRTLKEGIFAASPRDVKESIVHDVIFPAMRDFLADTAYTIVDVAIYGRGGSRPSRGRRRKSSGSGVFDYSKESTKRYDDRDTRTSAGYRLDNIFFETRREADDVFDALVEELEEKGSVSVYYFYEVSGKTALYTDHNYGWTSLEGTRYKRSEEGYALILPQPEKLKR